MDYPHRRGLRVACPRLWSVAPSGLGGDALAGGSAFWVLSYELAATPQILTQSTLNARPHHGAMLFEPVDACSCFCE